MSEGLDVLCRTLSDYLYLLFGSNGDSFIEEKDESVGAFIVVSSKPFNLEPWSRVMLNSWNWDHNFAMCDIVRQIYDPGEG